MDAHMYARMNGWMHACMDGCVYKHMNECVDEGCMDGWVDG